MTSPVPTAGPGTALLLDAAGTLLRPAVPVAQTYAAHARRFGVLVTPELVAARFEPAMAEAAPLRVEDGDWRGFWAAVVARCTGSDDPALLAALLEHFAEPGAWTVAAGAEACCVAVRARGMKVAIVSNWDRRLRPLLEGLGVLGPAGWIDAALISGEEGLEKPDPALFARACARLGVAPSEAVHVGDDPVADVEGARAAGCAALLLGRDVADFLALRTLLGATR